MFDPSKSVYDQLHSRPRHPTVQNTQEPRPSQEPEHASVLQDLSSPPTRSHWTRDENTTNCTSCTLKFTIIIRKHHCRKCGQIFCSECSKYRGKLDSKAQFHPLGYLSRLCISCYQGFVISLEGKMYSDEGGLIDSPSTGELGKEIADSSNISLNVENISPDQAEGASPAVPLDWQWSTF